MRKINTLIENLSLHVVAGSVCSALFAAAVLDTKLPFWWLLTLALAVWSVYTLDHLVDAYFNRGRIKNQRHHFHDKHFKKLLFMLVLTSITVLIIFSVFATLQIWLVASVITVVVLTHILFVSTTAFSNKKWLQKEVQIALIYSIGTWLGPLHYTKIATDIQLVMIFAAFTLLAWWETSFIALNERETDLNQQNSSLATRLGERKTKNLLLLLLLVQLVFCLVQFSFNEGIMAKAYLILLTMGIAFGVLFFFRKYLSKKGFLHLAGELVFCFPVLIYLV